MTLQLCKRIAQLRRDQKTAMPDVYLIPKIASFFGVTTDYLFGMADFEANNKSALAFLCALYYQRALEYLEKSNGACERIIAIKSESEWVQPAHLQMIRNKTMLGRVSVDSFEDFVAQFESSQTISDFIYLILALNETRQFEESLRWGEDWYHRFSKEDQGRIIEYLLEAACSQKDLDLAIKYFDLINTSDLNIDVKFFGRYKLWGLYKGLNMMTQKKATGAFFCVED